MQLFIGLLLFYGGYMYSNEIKSLGLAANTIESFHEIATQYNDQLPDLWNSLTPEERILAYYLYRASMCGNRILADQTHRDAVEITNLFEEIIHNKDIIHAQCGAHLDVEQFLSHVETLLVYLFANHGQYLLREVQNHKRTPDKLGLATITPENLVAVMQALGRHDAQDIVARLHSSLFHAHIEPTLTVEGDIEKSASNVYSSDFTEEDFAALDHHMRSAINAYFYIEIIDGKRVPKIMQYKIGGKYSDELSVALHWLTKAYQHAQQHPHAFDEHIVESLAHLLNFLVTGDEEDFKRFSIEWLKTKSRIDFNFGFIEVYQDPKQYRGAFAAEITVKTVDMAHMNSLLPLLERQLPFPEVFKRKNLEDISAIPNASVNAKIFASGDAGPAKITAAYCLPNYAEIRAGHGSKQIIYQLGKSVSELINPELSRRLFTLNEHVAWLNEHDADGSLDRVIWDVHVLLHETLGHGSGRLAQHQFVEGDPLAISGVTYAIGDTIEVTDININEFIGGYFSALEELRAESIALYTSIFNFDELAAIGVFKEWPNKIGKETLIERMIIHMAEQGIRRLVTQADDATEIMQAHARANTAITNYLLDHGGLELVEETYQVNGVDHTVVGIRLTNLDQTLQAIKDLVIEVQRIKSTADGQALTHLMKTYGTCIRHPHHIRALKVNRQAVQGDLKLIAEIFPRLMPVFDASGAMILDVAAEWPNSFLEQQLELSRLALSKEY